MLCVPVHILQESGLGEWLSHKHVDITDIATHDGRTVVFGSRTPECC